MATQRLTGAQRKREILEAAQSVFATSGLAGARTSQIAEAAGVAEGMLYKHFASKRELFEAAVTQPVAEFVQGVADGADGLLDRDGAGSENFYRSFLQTMTDVLPLLGVALFSDTDRGREFYNSDIVPLTDRYEAKLRRSLATMPDTDVDPAFLARAVIGMFFLLALDTSYRPDPPVPTTSDATADAVRSFVAGALTGSGTNDRSRIATEEAQARAQELETENATLRRILADQAIEIRRLRDALDDARSGKLRSVEGV